MASIKYTYSIENNTENEEVAVSKLTSEIRQSDIVTALDYISVNGDVLDIWMKELLSSGDETLLDSTVGSHDGKEEIIPQTVHLDSTYYGGKPSIRSESRPDGTSSYFTTRGDSASGIGDGTRLEWDFSNADNDVSAPSGFKKKQIEAQFADNIWVKEGTVYFYNTPKGATIDFFVVCPAGQYYYDRNGTPQLASEDVVLSHYVVAHPMQDSAPMGDELNTEAATIDAVPPTYKFRIEVTTPDTDTQSNGYAELEVYRERSVLLPGETV